jgi:hypothetical protein
MKKTSRFPWHVAYTAGPQSVLQLEVDRRDNDEEIVAVCYTMVCVWTLISSTKYRFQTSMIYVLRHLNSHQDRAAELIDQLEEQMANISNTIKEFGSCLTSFSQQTMKFNNLRCFCGRVLHEVQIVHRCQSSPLFATSLANGIFF